MYARKNSPEPIDLPESCVIDDDEAVDLPESCVIEEVPVHEAF